jgi:hypothetical protein
MDPTCCGAMLVTAFMVLQAVPAMAEVSLRPAILEMDMRGTTGEHWQ